MNIELMPERFSDRTHAGRALALKSAQYANWPDTLVLALPRGGVPAAYQVAAALNLPMDVVVVRKAWRPRSARTGRGRDRQQRCRRIEPATDSLAGYHGIHDS